MLSSARLDVLSKIFAQKKINSKAYSSLLVSFLTHFNSLEHYKLIFGDNIIPLEADDAKQICNCIYKSLIQVGLGGRNVGVAIPLIVIILANVNLEYSQGKSLEEIQDGINATIINSFYKKSIPDALVSLVNSIATDVSYSNFNEILRPYYPYLLLDGRRPFFDSVKEFNKHVELNKGFKALGDVINSSSELSLSTSRQDEQSVPSNNEALRTTTSPMQSLVSMDSEIDSFQNAGISDAIDIPSQNIEEVVYSSDADQITSDSVIDVKDFSADAEDYSEDIKAAKSFLSKTESSYSAPELALEVGSEMTLDATLKSFAIGGALVIGVFAVAKIFSNINQPK